MGGESSTTTEKKEPKMLSEDYVREMGARFLEQDLRRHAAGLAGTDPHLADYLSRQADFLGGKPPEPLI